jgi:hypothetical protein
MIKKIIFFLLVLGLSACSSADIKLPPGSSRSDSSCPIPQGDCYVVKQDYKKTVTWFEEQFIKNGWSGRSDDVEPFTLTYSKNGVTQRITFYRQQDQKSTAFLIQ